MTTATPSPTPGAPRRIPPTGNPAASSALPGATMTKEEARRRFPEEVAKLEAEGRAMGAAAENLRFRSVFGLVETMGEVWKPQIINLALTPGMTRAEAALKLLELTRTGRVSDVASHSGGRGYPGESALLTSCATDREVGKHAAALYRAIHAQPERGTDQAQP